MRKSVSLFAACLVFPVIGCVGGPVLDSEPVRIGQSERYEYWLPMRKRIDLKPDQLTPEQQAEGGTATVEYLIDSRGKVTDVRVVEVDPEPVWGVLAARVIAAQGFEPALTNPERIPVIVTQQVVFQGIQRP